MSPIFFQKQKGYQLADVYFICDFMGTINYFLSYFNAKLFNTTVLRLSCCINRTQSTYRLMTISKYYLHILIKIIHPNIQSIMTRKKYN